MAPLADQRTAAAHLAKLPPQEGRQFWRSFEELAADQRVVDAIRREFPEYADRLADGPTRRNFLQLMGASLALAGATGCVQQPQEQIVTYVRAPEQMIPGKPLYYATTMTRDGAGVGLLVENQSGRPIKVEGNPLHPAVPAAMPGANEPVGDGRPRFGATDAFAQASVLSLYDPDRSQTVNYNGQIDTWESFLAELQARLELLRQHDGRGLRLLTETVVSPTMADQLGQLLAEFPNAAWHQFEPAGRDQAVLGSRLAFGSDVEPIHHVEAADVIVSLDADFLSEGPDHLKNIRGFAERRRVDPQSATMNRLYVVETTPTLTGAAADHRLPVRSSQVGALARAIARELGLAAPESDGGDVVPRQWLAAVVEDLRGAQGRGLVLAGRGQPAAVHALAHWLNETLGNVGRTVDYVAPAAARPEVQVDSLRSLVEAMRADEVEALVILGGNPVYDAPADFDFAAALEHVPFSVHLSQYDDETSSRCRWHVPQTHLLESWSDSRAADGTASIVQPLIAPLYRGRTVHELLAVILGQPQPSSHDLVRGYWQRWHEQSDEAGDFDTFWLTALHNGVIPRTESPGRQAVVRSDLASVVAEQFAAAGGTDAAPLEIVFRPDPSVWDGRFANNGWLQELPRPLTKLTWDNAALMHPATAQEHQIQTGDVVEIGAENGTVRLPVFVVPGHPRNTVTLHLGYGRRRAGRVGNRVGTDVFPLRTSGAMWFAPLTQLRKTGRTQELATTQHHHLMDGRHLVRAGTQEEYLADPEHPAFMAVGHEPDADASLYPPFEYDGNKWGMVVDQSACVGCNACVVACQAENNIPIVGKDQVAKGREMHWLRIDRYYQGAMDNPTSYHQPVMCMHCELAPCEVVCPVAATTHSDEGLNEMTYNRCVGTRYCSNNCPYKVRRFNFLEYNAELKSLPVLQLRTNPDVTVRSRGVMEKCTYCVQRINAARIDAEKEDRAIRDGEVVTACQAACPARAIVFGNLNDDASLVTRTADSSLNYSLLGDLNTRPRTTYLAAVRNPNPMLTATGSNESAD